MAVVPNIAQPSLRPQRGIVLEGPSAANWQAMPISAA